MLEKHKWDYHTKQLYRQAKVDVEFSGKIVTVDSSDNEWIIYPDDRTWMVGFKIGEIEEVGNTCAIGLVDYFVVGDEGALEQDMVLARLTLSE